MKERGRGMKEIGSKCNTAKRQGINKKNHLDVFQFMAETET